MIIWGNLQKISMVSLMVDLLRMNGIWKSAGKVNPLIVLSKV